MCMCDSCMGDDRLGCCSLSRSVDVWASWLLVAGFPVREPRSITQYDCTHGLSGTRVTVQALGLELHVGRPWTVSYKAAPAPQPRGVSANTPRRRCLPTRLCLQLTRRIEHQLSFIPYGSILVIFVTVHLHVHVRVLRLLPHTATQRTGAQA